MVKEYIIKNLKQNMKFSMSKRGRPQEDAVGGVWGMKGQVFFFFFFFFFFQGFLAPVINIVTSIFAPEWSSSRGTAAAQRVEEEEEEEEQQPRTKTFVMDQSELGVSGPNESMSGFPDISPIRHSANVSLTSPSNSGFGSKQHVEPLFGALPSFLDHVEQDREIDRFQRSMQDLSLSSNSSSMRSSVSVLPKGAVSSSGFRRGTATSVAVSAARFPPPLTSFYDDVSERLSLLEAADPADRDEALARLRLLSEKFKHDPSSVPARLEDHLAWVREQKRKEEEKNVVDVVRGLTAEEQELYDRTMQGGNPDAVVTDKSVLDTFDMSLKKTDIWRLKPGEWLNDESINLYMKMIQKRGDDSKAKIHCFNSFFYELLTTSGYAKVARWSRRKDMFAMDLLLFPVHLGNHWCLGIMNMKKKRLEYYDSLGGGNPECFSAMKLYLESEHQDKKNKPMEWTGWGENVVNGKDLPRQLNGSDCGVFAAMFAEAFSRDAYPTFAQSDMPNLRKLMAVELVKGTFLSRK